MTKNENKTFYFSLEHIIFTYILFSYMLTTPIFLDRGQFRSSEQYLELVQIHSIYMKIIPVQFQFRSRSKSFCKKFQKSSISTIFPILFRIPQGFIKKVS